MTSTTLVDAAAVAYTEQQEADRDVRNEHIAIVWNSMLEFFGLEGIDVLEGGETSTARSSTSCVRTSTPTSVR
jgi:hypothetical protein